MITFRIEVAIKSFIIYVKKNKQTGDDEPLNLLETKVRKVKACRRPIKTVRGADFVLIDWGEQSLNDSLPARS